MLRTLNKFLIKLAIIVFLIGLTSCASQPLVDDCSDTEVNQECVKNKKKGGNNDDMERMD